jgi:uncharacterized coiled-coil protein SlyX
MSLATDREAVLLARIAQLEHDVAAQHKALDRVTDERNYWRTRYEQQAERIDKLGRLHEEIRNV